MRPFIQIASWIVFYGCGFLMWFFYIAALTDWLGFIGTIGGIVLAPGALVFPLVYWFVEGVFPTPYFALWGIGLVAMLIGGSASEG